MKRWSNYLVLVLRNTAILLDFDVDIVLCSFEYMFRSSVNKEIIGRIVAPAGIGVLITRRCATHHLAALSTIRSTRPVGFMHRKSPTGLGKQTQSKRYTPTGSLVLFRL